MAFYWICIENASINSSISNKVLMAKQQFDGRRCVVLTESTNSIKTSTQNSYTTPYHIKQKDGFHIGTHQTYRQKMKLPVKR